MVLDVGRLLSRCVVTMANATSGLRPLKPPRLSWSSSLTQMYPPKPAFTEKDVPDLSGKVGMPQEKTFMTD